MNPMRPILPCEGDGLSSRAPAPLRKRRASVQLHNPGALVVPCESAGDPRRYFIDNLVTGGNVPLPATDDNEVRYLVDAPAYFADLATAISSAGEPATANTFAADFVYIIGWYLGLDFPMVYDPTDECGMTFASNGGGPSSMGALLAAAAARGAEIRVLVWASMSPTNSASANQINAMFDSDNKRLNTFAICDNRLLLAGAHHQKLVVVRRAGQLTGWCGGIDINPDRLFPQHRDDRPTINKSIDRGDPYHDVQCRLRGPAAGYLLRTFTERWYDHKTHINEITNEEMQDNMGVADAELHLSRTRDFYTQGLKTLEEFEAALKDVNDLKHELRMARRARFVPPLCVDLNPPPQQPNPPTHDVFANRQIVQIGRTYGDPLHHFHKTPLKKKFFPFKNYRAVDPLAEVFGQRHSLPSDMTSDPIVNYQTYDFAPHGEQTIKQLLLRAIHKAQKFIYVEDQYLMDVDIARAIAAVMPRLAHFTALVPSDEDLETSFRANVATGYLTKWGEYFVNHAVPLRKRFVDIVQAAGGERARIFIHRDQGQPHTYVHSKMWIIDDEFVLIGSANCNQRSLTHDGEICAAIADQPMDQSCGLNMPRRLRIALWAEHLGMDTLEGHAELVDGVAAAAHWVNPPQTARIARHDTGRNIADVISTAVQLPTYFFFQGFFFGVATAVRGALAIKKYVIEPALVPFLFDPLGACPNRRISADGISTIANPIEEDMGVDRPSPGKF